MKTVAELKFDTMVKEVFYHTLKPLGFKRKGNNFYIKVNDIGKIINLQKSTLYSKDNIKFTINTGLFSPLYWDIYYNYPNKKLPDYPTEPECVIRRRIGDLLNTNDTWYFISDDTDVEEIKNTQQHNLSQAILPYFDRINSNRDIVNEFGNGGMLATSRTAKLIMLGELKMIDEAKVEYEMLLAAVRDSGFKETIVDIGKKYNLV